MKRKTCVLFLVLTLVTLSTLISTTAKADPDLNDIMNKLISIEERLSAIENSTGYNETATLKQSISEIQNTLNELDFSNLNEVNDRLDMLDEYVRKINDRLGYPDSKPDSTVYNDISLLLDGLTYKKDGITYWLLKNITGTPNMQILAENQQLIANYQISMNNSLSKDITDAKEDVKSNTALIGIDIKDNQGGTYILALLTLLLIAFFIAWKLYLKEKFFPSSNPGFRKQTNEGFGRPGCFGDSNEFDPGNNPNCGSCKWINKCKIAVMRGDTGEQNMETGLEVERDPGGNIKTIYDEGEVVDLPQCFGNEYDPQKNQDCRECAIGEYCAEQLTKNLQKRINVPPMQQTYRAQTQSSRRIVPTRGAVGSTFGEDILDEF